MRQRGRADEVGAGRRGDRSGSSVDESRRLERRRAALEQGQTSQLAKVRLVRSRPPRLAPRLPFRLRGEDSTRAVRFQLALVGVTRPGDLRLDHASTPSPRIESSSERPWSLREPRNRDRTHFPYPPSLRDAVLPAAPSAFEMASRLLRSNDASSSPRRATKRPSSSRPRASCSASIRSPLRLCLLRLSGWPSSVHSSSRRRPSLDPRCSRFVVAHRSPR